MSAEAASDRRALIALILNATVWGLSWWPLRQLAALGLDGLWATAVVFTIGSVALVLIWPASVAMLRSSRALWAIALAAGFTNACFNWGMTSGEVLRVVLLFYLMPVWAILLARWLLGEPITGGAILRALLAIAGAATVLWQPGTLIPWPASLGDWLGVAGGMSFGLLNVLLRRHGESEAPRRGATVTLVIAGVVGLVAVVRDLPMLLTVAIACAGYAAFELWRMKQGDAIAAEQGPWGSHADRAREDAEAERAACEADDARHRDRERAAATERELDRILEKIGREGRASLTAAERATLEAATAARRRGTPG